jgi:hypothetical protein
MEISIERVTPKMAFEYLQKNTMNRPINKSHLRSVCRQMRDGLWKSNGDSIRFSVTGELLDGQHRLLAICETGLPQDMIVVRGLPLDSFATIDSGSKRTAGDVVALAGYKNANTISAVARSIMLMQRIGHPFYVMDKSKVPTSSETLDFIDENPLVIEAATFSRSQPFLKQYIPASVSGFLYYKACSAGQKQHVISFLEGVAIVTASSIETPAYLFRERLLQNKSSREKMRKADLAAMMIKAYRYFRDGKSIKILRPVDNAGKQNSGAFDL